jgi:hypothetical protein
MNLHNKNLAQLKTLQRAIIATIQEMYYRSMCVHAIEKECALLRQITEEIKMREQMHQNLPIEFDYSELWQLLHQCNISAFPTKEDNGNTLTL